MFVFMRNQKFLYKHDYLVLMSSNQKFHVYFNISNRNECLCPQKKHVQEYS